MSPTIAWALSVSASIMFAASTIATMSRCRRGWRAFAPAFAICGGWATHVVCVATLETHSCIEAATKSGIHFPEAGCDNNLVACAILSGWPAPCMTVVLYLFLRRAIAGAT